MESKQYQEKAARTLATLATPLMDDVHMIFGMQTESAELADAYKKHIAYGKELDLVNVKEELGDLMWYIANMCNLHGWDMRDLMETNINKLQARYPEKFTNENAMNRDLSKERTILEGISPVNEDIQWVRNMTSAGTGGFSQTNTTSIDENM